MEPPGGLGDVKRVAFIACVVASLAARLAAGAAVPGEVSDVRFERGEWSPTRNEIELATTIVQRSLCGSGDSVARPTQFIVRPDGSALRRIAQPPSPTSRWYLAEASMEHVWSPDGNRLAFLAHIDSDDPGVLVVTRSGETALAPLYAEPTSWAPDSKRLGIYVYDPTQSPSNPAVLDVRTMSVKAKPKRRGLTRGRTRSWKKAIVQVRPGETIPIFQGLQALEGS